MEGENLRFVGVINFGRKRLELLKDIKVKREFENDLAESLESGGNKEMYEADTGIVFS